MNDCSDLECAEETPALPLNIYVPSRGNGDTVHGGTSAKVLQAFTLPVDLLMQNLFITLTGKHTSGSVRIGFQIHVMVSRVDADTPAIYSAEVGTIHAMNSEDTDIEVNVVKNGDAGVNITVTDTSGDAGTINWNFQIWVLDELLLS